MTIFSDIAKVFVIKCIQEECKRADDLNKSSYAVGRDVAHSETKIKYGGDLIEQIMQEPDGVTDKATADALITRIRECQTKAEKLCLETGHGVGKFDKALRAAVKLVDDIHYVFESRNLAYNVQPELDPRAKPISNLLFTSPSIRYVDPYDRVLFYASIYQVITYQKPEHEGYFTSWTRSLFPSTVKVGGKKSDLLQTTMEALKDALKSSERNKALYRLSRKQTVLMCLGAILGENNKICEAYSVRSNISALTALGGWVDLQLQWQCASGDLKKEMKKAQQEIQAMEMEEVENKAKNKGKEEDQKNQEDDNEALTEDESPKHTRRKKNVSLGEGQALFAEKGKQKMPGNSLKKKVGEDKQQPAALT